MTLGAAIQLVAFDFDGTLPRGDTSCEAVARQLGRLERMREFEGLSPLDRAGVSAARAEMASWYREAPPSELRTGLETLCFAPGAEAGFHLLREHGIRTAIVSITWQLVDWAVARLGAGYSIGTGLADDARITHIWPTDKATWLAALMRQLDLRAEQVAAVGDSRGDVEMLRVAGSPYFVGPILPAELAHAQHLPDADILEIARQIAAADTYESALPARW